MDKFIKRIQTRASRKGISVSKQQVRDAYQVIVEDTEKPTEQELIAVIEHLEAQTVESSELTLQQPETIEVTPENDDIWENLEPPVEENQEQEAIISGSAQSAIASVEASVNSPVNAPLATTQPSNLQPSNLPTSNGLTTDELQNQIEEKFKGYPLDIKKQITDYAAQNTFSNLNQAQDFLEQLRSMEFTLMMELLTDHNSKRQNLASIFQQELDKLNGRDTAQQNDFFVSSRESLEHMKQVILTRMAQSAI